MRNIWKAPSPSALDPDRAFDHKDRGSPAVCHRAGSFGCSVQEIWEESDRQDYPGLLDVGTGNPESLSGFWGLGFLGLCGRGSCSGTYLKQASLGRPDCF